MSSSTRTILAFMIVLVILMLYNVYLARQRAPEQAREAPRREEPEEPPSEAPVLAVADICEDEDTVIVHTDLYRVTLSDCDGGTITSFQLKSYEGIGGGWAERVRDLQEWSQKEIKGEVQDGGEEWKEREVALKEVDGWLRSGYMSSAQDEGWIDSLEILIQNLGQTYLGCGTTCDGLLRRIEELPSWMRNHYAGWVELIPVGERALSFGGDTLDGLRPTIEREKASDEEVIRFRYESGPESVVTKAFHFPKEGYLFSLNVTGDAGYTSLLWGSGLAMTEGNRGDDLAGFASVALMGGELQKENLGSLKKAGGKKSLSGQVDWVGVKTKYFVACAIPEDPTRTRGFSAGLPSASGPEEEMNEAVVGCMPHRGVRHSGSTRISVALISPEERRFSIYIGPIDFEELKRLGVGAEKVVDFGWSWIAPLSRLLFRVLKSLHGKIGNYGLVIIIFSIIMKIIFYPLTHRGTKAMREMQKLQPKIKQLQQQYKKDPQRLNAEMAKIGASPLKQLAGCFPLLLQMPIFIALYSVLRTTIELRRASFISFWIRDLSVQDPYYILPLLMGAFMLLQSFFTAVDPRQRWSTLFMPVVITIIFLNFPAGLVLYWLVNNIFSVVEHFLVARKEATAST